MTYAEKLANFVPRVRHLTNAQRKKVRERIQKNNADVSNYIPKNKISQVLERRKASAAR